MRIALIEPFMAGSHAAWSREYARFSRHQVDLYTLPGTAWKWRMHGGAITLARQILQAKEKPDVLLVSAMCDLTTLLALLRREMPQIPAVLYFHENQLTYPWSEDDPCRAAKRDAHYGFIQWASALVADEVWFNSTFHRRSFLEQLPAFLAQFPDYREVESVAQIEARSHTHYLGVDLTALDAHRPTAQPAQKAPLLLWNHRWEYDKNPTTFFEALMTLAEEDVPFQLAVLGQAFRQQPPIFDQARQHLGSRIVHWGYAESLADYAGWLWQADLLPVTSHHDFFGASVVQALYCGCRPLLPNRLAYPEHLPPEMQLDGLYPSDDAFLPRLRQALTTPASSTEALRTHVARYDWTRIAPEYDSALEHRCADVV